MAGSPRRSLLTARLRGDLGDEPTGGGQQVILDQLRRVILDGDVLPGTPIPVDEVAGLFGVSRIPVREVLKTLRRFHLALLAHARTQRLLRMLESAWNLTEPCRPMAQIPDSERAALHAEHRDMLDAFLARDVERLATVSAAHHRHLEESIAALPPGSAVFAWSDPRPPVRPR